MLECIQKAVQVQLERIPCVWHSKWCHEYVYVDVCAKRVRHAQVSTLLLSGGKKCAKSV